LEPAEGAFGPMGAYERKLRMIAAAEIDVKFAQDCLVGDGMDCDVGVGERLLVAVLGNGLESTEIA
jgi:hypothetical protein